eukprot:gene22521-biopygen13281
MASASLLRSLCPRNARRAAGPHRRGGRAAGVTGHWHGWRGRGAGLSCGPWAARTLQTAGEGLYRLREGDFTDCGGWVGWVRGLQKWWPARGHRRALGRGRPGPRGGALDRFAWYCIQSAAFTSADVGADAVGRNLAVRDRWRPGCAACR